jgi:hypothetical protein
VQKARATSIDVSLYYFRQRSFFKEKQSGHDEQQMLRKIMATVPLLVFEIELSCPQAATSGPRRGALS